MAKVKICGVTCQKDIEILNKYLPDYAGFVFAPGRRRVAPEAAGRLAAGLDGSVRRAGVFVNASRQELLEAVEIAGLDVVQLHGDETPEEIGRLRGGLKAGVEIWKALKVRDAGSLSGLGRYGADRYLLDAYVEGSYGGAGKVFDWSYAAAAGDNAGIVLAGGLNPENVAEAVRTVRPFAVDVSSGVETGGYKDESRVRDFLNAVREVRART